MAIDQRILKEAERATDQLIFNSVAYMIFKLGSRPKNLADYTERAGMIMVAEGYHHTGFSEENTAVLRAAQEKAGVTIDFDEAFGEVLMEDRWWKDEKTMKEKLASVARKWDLQSVILDGLHFPTKQ